MTHVTFLSVQLYPHPSLLKLGGSMSRRITASCASLGLYRTVPQTHKSQNDFSDEGAKEYNSP
eukprot:3668091-Amphidinium_carterae.1